MSPVITLFPAAELSCAIQGVLWFLSLCQWFKAAIVILNPQVERNQIFCSQKWPCLELALGFENCN